MRLAALLHGRRLPPGVEASGAVLERGVRFELGPGARVVLAPGSVVGEGTRFIVRSGEVSLGAGARLGRRCIVRARERVTIGAGVRTGDFVMLTDAIPVHADVELPTRLQGVRTAPVEIGVGALLGARCCVLAGVTVGPGAVLEAGSVAARDVPGAALHVGVPAGAPARPPARRRPR